MNLCTQMQKAGSSFELNGSYICPPSSILLPCTYVSTGFAELNLMEVYSTGKRLQINNQIV